MRREGGGNEGYGVKGERWTDKERRVAMRQNSEYGSGFLSEIQNALGLAFEVFQVVGTGAGVRAAFFRCDFLIFMRANCFSVGAKGPDFPPL